jgi:hypothetical protein
VISEWREVVWVWVCYRWCAYEDGAGVRWWGVWGPLAPSSHSHSHSDFVFDFGGCYDRDSGKQQD